MHLSTSPPFLPCLADLPSLSTFPSEHRVHPSKIVEYTEAAEKVFGSLKVNEDGSGCQLMGSWQTAVGELDTFGSFLFLLVSSYRSSLCSDNPQSPRTNLYLPSLFISPHPPSPLPHRPNLNPSLPSPPFNNQHLPSFLNHSSRSLPPRPRVFPPPGVCSLASEG